MNTRRHFLLNGGKALAAVTGATGLGLLESLDSALAQPRSPLEQIRIGCIGLGNQGRPNLTTFLRHVVAVCDVDSERLALARATVEKANKRCLAFDDYRRLLESKDIDAVVITTPDHWHARMTVDACLAEKDVYCEKPLTLTVAEGRTMVQAARKMKRIVQTGSQQRSSAVFREACELVRAGRLGRLQTIRVGIPNVNFKGLTVADSDAPKQLNYNLWLGPAPQRPYNAQRVHYNFRFFWDYSGGQLTNWGAHHLDIVQWALGMDQSGPTRIEGQVRYQAQKRYEVPEWCSITYTYANGVRLLCEMGGRNGVLFEGEKGSIFVTRGKLEVKPEELRRDPIPQASRLYESRNHAANWLECLRNRRLPICDVEIGHRSASVCHLGNIALRTGRVLTWDPIKEQIVGDAAAAAQLTRTARAPWGLPAV